MQHVPNIYTEFNAGTGVTHGQFVGLQLVVILRPEVGVVGDGGDYLVDLGREGGREGGGKKLIKHLRIS